MSKATREPELPGKKIVTSFLLLLILIGSTISSALLLGLTVSPQQAWAAVPNAPTGLSPATGTFTSDQTPTFSWNRVLGANAATSYDLLVDNNNDFGSPEINVNVPQPGSNPVYHTPSTNLAEGIYFWKVRGKNADGDGAFTTTRTLNINVNPPPAPTLQTPADGAFTNDATPDFDWSDVTDAVGIKNYTIQVDNNDNFGSPEFQASPTTSSITSSSLSPGVYYWHVRAADNGNLLGPYSSAFRFTRDTDGIAPTVTASPTTGTFGPGTTVTLSSTDADIDKFYYKLDGTEPTPQSPGTEYTGPISIPSDPTPTTLKAIAKDDFKNFGTVLTEVYTIDSTGPVLSADKDSGTYGPGLVVTLSSDDPAATIFYTIDGSTPDSTSTPYAGPISIPDVPTPTTLRAIAKDTFGTFGDEITRVYTITTGPVTIDTSMSLQLSGNSKVTPGATFTASGKLIDAVSDSPIAGKEISVTIDGSSPVTATTDNKGMFNVQLTAPTTIGNHDIQAHFAGDAQYNPSDSPIRKLKVEGAAPADTSLSLKLENNKINAGSSYSASGTLINEVTKSPISGETISVTTDDSAAQTAITDSKGKFTVQLTAPSTNGDRNIQAHFAGNSQYKSSDSSVSKLTVQGGTTLAITTASATDTSLSLKLEGKDKMTPGSTYTVSGKLIDSASKKSISGKEISVTTDGGSPKGTDDTNAKGEFEVKLKAPDSSGKYDIKAHFAGDSKYKSSDSSVTKITVEDTTLTNQKTKITTDQQQTDQQQTDQQQTDQQQTDQQQTDDQKTDDQKTDDQKTDDQKTDDQKTDDQKTDDQKTDEQPADEEPTN
jgi:Chitobiase/beta-hexosaminidase C-terminal domain/Bacterial Ig-like domain (group 3)